MSRKMMMMMMKSPIGPFRSVRHALRSFAERRGGRRDQLGFLSDSDEREALNRLLSRYTP